MGGSALNAGVAGYEIAVSSSKDVFTYGVFKDIADFDPSNAFYYLVAPWGGDNIFVQKMSQCHVQPSFQIVDACNSYTWPANNQTYTTTGPRSATLQTGAGCDSLVTLNLTIRQSTSSNQTAVACSSYTWPVNGQTYTTSGPKTGILQNSEGCDSVITLNLTINQASSSTLTQSSCNSFTLNNQTYSQSGTYTQTLTNAQGCDSVLTLISQLT